MKKLIKPFSDLKVRTRLNLMTVITLLSITLLALGANFFFRSGKALVFIVNAEREHARTFHTGISSFNQLSDSEEDLQRTLHYLDQANQNALLFSTIDSILENMPRKEWSSLLLSTYGDGLNNKLRNAHLLGNRLKIFFALNLPQIRQSKEIAGECYRMGVLLRENLLIWRNNPTAENYTRFRVSLNATQEHYRNFSKHIDGVIDLLNTVFINTLLFWMVALIAVSWYFSAKISRSLTAPIEKLVENFNVIATGNIHSVVNIDSDSEIGELSRSFNRIQAGFQEVVNHAKLVAQGEFGMRLEPKSEADELSVALNQMSAGLLQSKEKEEAENWIRNGMTELVAHIQGDFAVRDLAERIIRFTTGYLQVEAGAVYTYDELEQQLELTASVGLNPGQIKKLVALGEGLVGKVAKEQEFLSLTAPLDDFKSYSASGEVVLRHVYIFALVYNQKVRGVVELAATRPLSEVEIRFLKKASEAMAIQTRTAVSRYRLEELLRKTRQQSEELTRHQEILQQNLAEKQAFQEELEKRILENEEMQKVLEWEKSLLDTLMNNLPDKIYFKDTESRFIKVSKSMANSVEIADPKELAGKTDFDIFTEDHARPAFEAEQEIIRTRRPIVGLIEKEICRDGKVRYVSSTKMPFLNEKGELLGTFGISSDVTEIKQLELELTERNADLEAQKEKMRLANEELYAQQEEIRAAHDELSEHARILTENEKKLQVQQEELRVANEELEQRAGQLEMQKSEIVAKNNELLEVYNKLQHKAGQLEASSRYKSEFLANMSHELRTPLNSLLILSKILTKNKLQNLTDDQLKSVKIIHKSGTDLLQLINEILDLSKIEAGKVTLERSVFPVNEVQNEILQDFQPVADEKKIDLKVTLSPGFPTLLYSDRNRLMQVIRNLVANAFKFTSAGGVTVRFGLPPAGVAFRNEELNSENSCFISIEDTGIGIPADKLGAIFEAFQQADGSISRRYGGTGLGLSISRELTRMLGGEIHVHSEVGKGSVFTLYLPLNKSKVSGEEPGTVPPKKERPETASETGTAPAALPRFITDDRDNPQFAKLILVIQGDEQKALQTSEQCRSRGFGVIAARSIADGVVLARAFLPKAIILAPEMNLAEDIQRLKKESATRNLPVHLFTRIEDDLLSELEELKTAESEDIGRIAENIKKAVPASYRNILLVEDDPATREAIHLLFEGKELNVDEARSGQQAYEKIRQKNYDCIILDLGLPDFTGQELLEKLQQEKIRIPNVIIHTARELTAADQKELRRFSNSIVIKGIKSDERLMDEVTLFLHQLETTLPRPLRKEPVHDADDSIFAGKRILIVDDDIRNIFALAQILEEKGIEIVEAENGRDALNLLSQDARFDLILMDLMMPEMDGYEAMKTIRGDLSIREIPIIAITAKAMKDDYHEAIRHGANDYIAKPVDDQKLFSLLKIWLSN